jgi:AGCS family alanine or glycine:cation symporter
METVEHFLNATSGVIWGPLMLTLLVGVGIYLTVGLRAITWRRLLFGLRLLWRSRTSPQDDKGDITPFQALMTALSATVGSGNIAGVATAIYLGGPGAVFWMWVTALFGMASKYGEAVLAVHFREVDELGNHVGGPMYYIQNGLGSRWRWLAVLFSLFGSLAAFGIGNTVQANTVATAVESSLHLPVWISGLVMAVFTGAVIIGGVRRLGAVAATLVPFMAISYFAGALIIILLNVEKVPTALMTIIHHAFTGTAAAGGFAGATVLMAIHFGVARGLFSNEAGMGSAPIAHAAAKTKDPVHQGLIAMLGTFIDTLVICTMTALVIIVTGSWTSGQTGVALTSEAFNTGLAQCGGIVVTLALILFAFTTLLGWSYYGERCAEYLFGVRAIYPFRILWVIAIPIGAMGNLGMVWTIADILNGLMAIPNLIALLALSPIIFHLTRQHSITNRQS